MQQPTSKKEQRGEQLHKKIPKGNTNSAIRTDSAKEQPRKQWNVPMRWYGLATAGTKGARWVIDRHPQRHAVNHHVEKRTYASSEKERGKRPNKK
jgi:hypothetical protein